MKTNSRTAFSACFGALLGLMGVMMAASVSAQTVDLVAVEKFSDYQQTGAATTQPAANPYGFAVSVEGTGIAPGDGFTAPTFSSPGGSGDTLGYDVEDNQWIYEVLFSDQGALNTAFADGTYTVNVGGATLNLAQSGSSYPNTPTAAFNQGFWSGGVYYFDPTQSLVITTNAFTAYNDNVDAFMEIDVYASTGASYDIGVSKFHDADGGANTLSLTILASAIDPGQTLEMEIGFISIMAIDSDVLLPGALIASAYSTFTRIQLQAIPEPSTYALLVGGAGLAVAVWLRRRAAETVPA